MDARRIDARRLAARIGAAAAAAVLAALAPTLARAGGEIFDVDSTKDLPDAVIDGVCATVTGVCTLRAAVQEANATVEEDVINLPKGKYGLKLVGAGEDAAATGDLDILQDLTINGDGPKLTVVSGKKDRVFEIFPGVTVAMTGLTIRKGNVGKKGDASGDAVSGGGIRNDGTLMLSDAVVTANKALDDGGGIANVDGTLVLENVVVSKNQAGDDAGGIDHDGGDLTMTDVTISKNKAGDEGGGLETEGGTVTAMRVTIDGNKAKTQAGGVNAEQGGTFTATNTTISGNKAGRDGGGVRCEDGASVLVLTNVTLKNNKAKEPGAAVSNPGGGKVLLANVLLDKNKKVTCAGPVASAGGNVEDTDTCGFGAGDVAGIKKLDVLGLKNNGGATRTHALKPTSPAVDAGVDDQCPAEDQRGAPRVALTCDSGAFELQLAP